MKERRFGRATVTQAPVPAIEREPPPEPPPPEEEAPSRRLKQAHVVITALLALITGAIALAFQIAPGLKPDPRDRVGADVTIFALEPGVTLGQWIQRGFPAGERAELEARYPDRAAVGELLYVNTAVDGHKHRDVTLRYAVYHGRRQTRIPDAAIDGPQLDPLSLSAPNERSVQVLWVPDLRAETTPLFVRVELWDEDGMLAVSDSPQIVRGRFDR
jgi:hypothetical protein